MKKVDVDLPSETDVEGYNFLSTLWASSLAGEEPPEWQDYGEIRNVLTCDQLTVTVPAKQPLSPISRVTQLLKGRCRRSEKATDLVLLDKVSAEIHGGEILAVLGPSGAGKTLFLSALLGHPSVKGGKISGDVRLNGQIMDVDTFNGSTAFVPQKDIAVESLTVDEHMQFHAALRLWQEPLSKRTARITELLHQLKLQELRSRELRSLSNGERRRIAIASQMITRPAVLLLDEPLTGLDASVAEFVMATIARAAVPTPTAPRGCAVVCVLHQPRPQCLRFVSKMMFIADGRVAFYGSADDSENFYLRVYPDKTTKLVGWRTTLESFMASLNGSEEAAFITHAYRQYAADYQPKQSQIDAYAPLPIPVKKPPWATQLRWLFWRETLDARNAKIFDMATIMFLVTASIIGVWYIRSNERDFAGMQTASGLLFMVTSEIIYTCAYAVLYSFAPQVPLLLREKRLYGPSAFYISKSVSLLPRALLQTALFATVVHVFGNLGGDGGLFTFLSICAVLCVVSVAATAYGCMLAGVSQNIEMAYSIAQPLDLLANSLGGIFGSVHRRNVLKISWLKFFSTFFYSYECTSILYWSTVNQIDCTGAPAGCPTTGALVLTNGDFEPKHLSRDLLLLAVYISSCHLIGFTGIFFRYRRQAVY